MQIKTYTSNGVSLHRESAIEYLENALDYLKPYTTPEIYTIWKSLVYEKNGKYGQRVWTELGFRGIFCSVFMKYQRWRSSPHFDAIIDILGYSLLGIALCQALGHDLNGIQLLEYGELNLDEIIDDGMKRFWVGSETTIEEAFEFFPQVVASSTEEFLDAKRLGVITDFVYN